MEQMKPTRVQAKTRITRGKFNGINAVADEISGGFVPGIEQEYAIVDQLQLRQSVAGSVGR